MAARGRIESLARWWGQASEEARFEALKKAAHGYGPATLEEVHIAAYLAECEAGTVSQG